MLYEYYRPVEDTNLAFSIPAASVATSVKALALYAVQYGIRCFNTDPPPLGLT